MTFDKSYFTEIFSEQDPDIYFKVFSGKEVIKNTRDSVISNYTNQNTELIIMVEADCAQPGERRRNIFSDKNETVRIDTFEQVDHTNVTSLMSFSRRIGQVVIIEKNWYWS